MARDEYGLTSHQRAFADEYINNKGNATKAYLIAYPNIKKESTASSNGSKLLRNTKVSKYIADRTAELLEKAKMNQDEIIASLTRIARREVQTSYYKSYDHLTKEVVKEVTSTFQPSIEEATKALDVLVKFIGSPLENEKTRVQIEKAKAEISYMGDKESQDNKLDRFLDIVEGEVSD